MGALCCRVLGKPPNWLTAPLAKLNFVSGDGEGWKAAAGDESWLMTIFDMGEFSLDPDVFILLKPWVMEYCYILSLF